MPGNTTFFIKAANRKITWRDIFSNVFKKHSREDGERLFTAGMAHTTPHESVMLGQWQKPWLFAYIGMIGFAFLAVMFIINLMGGDVYALVPAVFVGALIPPLTVLLLMWEMNIPRNIPIYTVLAMLLIGGGLSLVFTFLLGEFIVFSEAHWAPLTEEPAKLIALCLFLRKPKHGYILNGILIGCAIGAGFAAFETMGYFFRTGFSYGNLILRGLLSPGCHVVWAALYGGALAMAKGNDKLKVKHFADYRFLAYFGIACLLHFIWNFNGLYIFIIQLSSDIVITVKHILLIVAAWICLLRIVKQGVLQCMQIPQAPQAAHAPYTPYVSIPVAQVPAQPVASSYSFRIKGLAGIYKDGVFPSVHGRLAIGRDGKYANIVYPPDTRGISALHCEVSFQNGMVFLTDKNSSNGTFLADGTKLIPGKPYPISKHNRFYLGNRENMFELE